MTIPTTFRNVRERIITSFNFTDIATGIGTARYFGQGAESGTILTVVVADATNPSTSGTTDGSSPEDVFESNFDLLFKQSSVIEGPLSVTLTLEGTSDQGNITIRPKVTIYHVGKSRGETIIGPQVTGEQSLNIATGVTRSKRYCIDFDLPKTTFKEGEKFRVEIIATVTESDGNGGSVILLYHESSDRTDSAQDIDNSSLSSNKSTLTVDIPFRIDL